MKKYIKNRFTSKALAVLTLLNVVQIPLFAVCDPNIENRIEYKVNRILRDVEIINNVVDSQCELIPFSLGNGLPEGAAGAIANSDGTFGPFIISTPGNYVLRNSPQMQISGSVYTPNHWEDANPAIIIQSSDVDLDLCGQTITGSGNLTQQYFIDNGIPTPNVPGGIQNDVRVDATIGILVNPDFADVSNVAIHGGKLQYHMTALLHWKVSNFRVYDMRIENNGSVTAVQNVPPFNFFPNAVVGQQGSNVTYNNIQFLNSRSADMSLTSVRNAVCTNFESTGCRGNTQANTTDVYFGDPEWVEFGEWAASLVIFFCDNTVFDNIVIRDLKALITVFGIYISFGSDTRITNCFVSDVEQHAVDTTRFVENLNLFAFEGRAYAIEFVNGNSVIENCMADNLNMRIKNAYDVAQFGAAPNSASSYNICCGSESVILRDCSASNITTAGDVTFSVPFNAQTVFPNPAEAFPVGSTSAVYENCVAIDVNGGLGASTSMASPGIGFHHYADPLSATPSTLEYRSCIAENCIGDNNSAGFDMESNCTLVNCHSSTDSVLLANNPSNGFIFKGAANIAQECVARGHSLNGFDFTSTATTSLVVDSISNENGLSGFNVSGSSISLVDNIADFNGAYGFHVDGTSATVIGNSANQNVVGGFLDDSIGGAQANNNLYKLNEAFNNGSGTTIDNYDIDYVNPGNPTVLQTGTITPPVFPVTTGQANVSITPS